MAASNNNDELISMEDIIVNRHEHTSFRNKLHSLKDAIRDLEERKNDKREVSRRPSPKIQKASYMLPRDREKMGKYFEPRMVCIGPLHYGGVQFNQAEELKLKLAALFIKAYKLNEDHLYKEINGQMGSLRNCYFEKDIDKFKNDDLAGMF